ncbi:MAG: hypothetical protein ACOYPR_12695 [Saprospiraceae bacterium]
MESIHLALFENSQIAPNQVSMIHGGRATGHGSKTLGAGTSMSVELSWGSDEETLGTNGSVQSTTYYGTSTCNDEDDPG